jgi:hypothetical protein
MVKHTWRESSAILPTVDGIAVVFFSICRTCCHCRSMIVLISSHGSVKVQATWALTVLYAVAYPPELYWTRCLWSPICLSSRISMVPSAWICADLPISWALRRRRFCVPIRWTSRRRPRGLQTCADLQISWASRSSEFEISTVIHVRGHVLIYL